MTHSEFLLVKKKEENNRVTGQCVPVKENEVKGKSLLHCPSNASSLNEIEVGMQI